MLIVSGPIGLYFYSSKKMFFCLGDTSNMNFSLFFFSCGYVLHTETTMVSIDILKRPKKWNERRVERSNEKGC